MLDRQTPHHCLIVGGGMAGLFAGRKLLSAGVQVTVLDKGRGIGGRMATRRISNETTGEGVFDYGAQYFTARDPRFQQYVNSWIELGVVRTWSDGFHLQTGGAKTNGEPRYIGIDGMRGITRHLARDLITHRQTRVIRLEHRENRWQISTEQGRSFAADSLMLTPPLPQTITLLNDSGIALPNGLEAKLRTVSYLRCIAMLALLKAPSNVPAPGGVWGAGDPIQWIADNQQKGISPEAAALTIHAGPAFSEAHWETKDADIADRLVEAAGSWLDAGALVHYQVHRWRYSQSDVALREPFVFADLPAPLLLAGDGFTKGRVEGAALSGLAAAEQLLRYLNLE